MISSSVDYRFDDGVQDFLEQEEWYNNLSVHEKLDLLGTIEELADQYFRDKMIKLYHACLHAYQWHCGSSSEAAEKDCMKVLQDAIDLYTNNGIDDEKKTKS